MLPPVALVLVALAQPADVDARLAEYAREAVSANRPARVEDALRVWATLRHRAQPLTEPDLRSPSADALSWAADQGLLRLYATRLPDRVRAGVRDPASAVARVEAFFLDAQGLRQRLFRMDEEDPTRFEYALPPGAEAHEVQVEAVMTRFGDPVVIARSVLVPGGASPPSAPVLAVEPVEAPEPVAAPEPFGWWWIAAGAIAAGLAGAAVVEELR